MFSGRRGRNTELVRYSKVFCMLRPNSHFKLTLQLGLKSVLENLHVSSDRRGCKHEFVLTWEGVTKEKSASRFTCTTQVNIDCSTF